MLYRSGVTKYKILDDKLQNSLRKEFDIETIKFRVLHTGLTGESVEVFEQTSFGPFKKATGFLALDGSFSITVKNQHINVNSGELLVFKISAFKHTIILEQTCKIIKVN